MKTYTHKPTQAQAIQVTKPIVNVQKKVPMSRPVKANGGRFAYFLITDPKDPLTPLRAYEGDWILRHPSGRYEIRKDVEFKDEYEENDDRPSD